MHTMRFIRFNLLIVIISFVAGNASFAEPIEKLKIGAILPLTGEAASIGTSARNGMELALRKLKPEVRERIEVHFADDALQAKVTVTEFNKLVEHEQVQVVFNISSGTGNAISPLAERSRIPLVACASDPKVVEGRKYVVNFFVSPEQQAKTLVPYLTGQGLKSVARITSIQDGLLAQKKAIDEENAGRIRLVLDEEYPVTEKDFRTYIAKLRSRGDIDGVVALLLTGQVGTFAKQLRQAGFDKPIIGSETYEDTNEVTVSENALVGARYVNSDDPLGTFVKEYSEAYPGASIVFGPYGHDVILLLAQGMEQGVEPEQLNKYLHTVSNFTGALGTYSATNDNRFSLPAVMKEVTTKGFQKLHH